MSDSIAKYVTGIDGVHLQAFSGDTIGRMTNRLLSGENTLENFDYVVFHVGTNNVARNESFESIISDYGNLIGICRKIKPKIKIILSAILPRPVDHAKTDPSVRRINPYILKKMSKHLNIRFLGHTGHSCLEEGLRESSLPNLMGVYTLIQRYE